jgi:hypothetical protein
MVRRVVAALTVFLFMAGLALAADKEVACKVIKVDVKKKTLTVLTDDGRKVYTVNEETKFIGPKGGVSDEGIKDDRLVPGAAIKMVIAGNNKTVREVHLPERKKGGGV